MYLTKLFVKNQFHTTIVMFIIAEELLLLDLKHLLIEAKQKIPAFLAILQSESEQYLNVGGG